MNGCYIVLLAIALVGLSPTQSWAGPCETGADRNQTETAAAEPHLYLSFNTSCSVGGTGSAGFCGACPRVSAVSTEKDVCECLAQFRRCVELHSAKARMQLACPAAGTIYINILTIEVGSSFMETPLGASCVALACTHGAVCSCNGLQRQVTRTISLRDDASVGQEGTTLGETPALAAETAVANPPPPPPPTTTTTTTTMEAGEGETVVGPTQFITLTVQGSIANFNKSHFVVLLARVLDIPSSRIDILSVEGGSVVIRFSFAEKSTLGGGKTSAELVQYFLTVVAVSDNELSEAFPIISATSTTATEETTELSTAAPTLEESTVAPSPLPSSTSIQGEEDEGSSSVFGKLSTLEVVATIVGGAVFVIVFALIIYRCVKGRDRVASIKGNDIRRRVIDVEEEVTVFDLE